MNRRGRSGRRRGHGTISEGLRAGRRYPRWMNRRAGVHRNTARRTEANRLNLARSGRGDAHGLDRVTHYLRYLARRRSRIPLRSSIVNRLANGARRRVRCVETFDWERVVINVSHDEVRDRNKAPVRLIKAVVDGEAGGSQGDPADVASAKAPIHPRRSPLRARDPDPSVVVIHHPAPIVKGRPAPGVVALEGPTVIRVDPVPAAEIGAKIAADQGPIGPPGTSETPDHYPFTVRRQRTFKGLRRNAPIGTEL